MTTSSEPVERLYTPRDAPEASTWSKLGFPGEWPYTRGVHATGYRGKLWTMRMFAGFGNAEETNERFKYLLANGNDGPLGRLRHAHAVRLRHRRSQGRRRVRHVRRGGLVAGRHGGPVRRHPARRGHHVDDHQQSGGHDLGDVPGRTPRSAASPSSKLSGTTQNDILKEYIAQKEYIFPPRPSTKLVVDTFEYGAQHVPRWNTISISGYHIREAGATALQELAFTLADGIQYVQAAVDAGLDVDCFAPRLSFFFDIHNDFLEEIAKLRAARRVWAQVMQRAFRRAQRALAVVPLPLARLPA